MRPVVAAMIVAALVLAACAGRMPPLAGAPLTLDALLNGDYASEFPAGGRAVLMNGVYREGREADRSTRLVVTLDQSFYAFGDLDGDGARDAAVILAADPGGSGTFLDLAAVVDRGGAPLHAGSLRLGDRVGIESLKITGRIIELVLLRHAPDDPRCCPTARVRERYLLRGGSLVAAP